GWTCRSSSRWGRPRSSSIRAAATTWRCSAPTTPSPPSSPRSHRCRESSRRPRWRSQWTETRSREESRRCRRSSPSKPMYSRARQRPILPMNRKLFWLAAAIVAVLATPATARAQLPADTAIVYEREVFEYSRAGRSDPFRSLLDDSELGVRLEDLSLQGVMYDADASQSVAVLS